MGMYYGDDTEGVTGPGSGAWNDTDQDNGAPTAGGGGGAPQALPDPAQHKNEYFTIDIEGTRITYLSIPGKYAGEWDWKEVMQSRPPRGREYDPERTTAAERAEERAARAQQAQDALGLGYAQLGNAVTPEEREQLRLDSKQAHEDLVAYQNRMAKITEEKNKNDLAISEAELEEKKALRLSNEAKAKGELEESKRQFDISQAWNEKKLAYERLDKELDREERGLDRELQKARDAVTKGAQLGFIDGQPTLARQQFEAQQKLDEDKFNAELARGPGNFYNNLYRQSGVEPPPLPSRPQAQAAPAAPSTQAQAPEAPKDLLDWRNYSLGDLEKFPDMYLQTLPKEVLESFRNEFLLGRPALMALLSPERIRGEGKWQGTGFAPDMVTKWGKGAPAPAAAAAPPVPTTTPPITGTGPPRAGGMGVTGGGPGKATVARPGKVFITAPAAAPPFGGPGPGSISFPGSGLPPGSTGAPGMTAPTEADAIAALEEIRRRRPVGVA